MKTAPILALLLSTESFHNLVADLNRPDVKVAAAIKFGKTGA
jgi:hypothetical protein